MYQTNSKQENSFSSLVMKKSNLQKSPKKIKQDTIRYHYKVEQRIMWFKRVNNYACENALLCWNDCNNTHAYT